jgi:hypothetical protein
MTSVATAISAVTPAVAITIRRPFERRIQPTALKADADNGSTSQQGDKAQHNQDHGPVHNTSRTFQAKRVAQEYGPLEALRPEGCA